ncbi:MAG: hypothetical protein IK046_03860 [Clostridia bacterium]|nr:hypothetical protein [Clostridia bacterium]
MKRILALLMILIMVLSFAGCSGSKEKTQPTYADGQDTTIQGVNVDLSSFDGKLIKPYLALIATRNFYYQKTDTKTGDVFTFTCIGNDEKISLSQGASFIKMGDGRIFYVEGNYYFELTDQLVTKNNMVATFEDVKTVLASYEALVFGMLELVPMNVDTTLDIPGYVHEEYMDVENNYSYSFFFNQTTGELASVVEVTTANNAVYDVQMGTPSPNAINNIFANGTLVDNQTALEADVSGTGTTADTTAAQTTP